MRRSVGLALFVLLPVSCSRDAPPEPRPAPSTASRSEAARRAEPRRVDVVDHAMGTEVRIVAYTAEGLDEAAIRQAGAAALAEIRRLESLMSSWRDDTDVGRINASPGRATRVSPETFEVFEKARWASDLSEGAFDVSFNAMADVWKFGDAAESPPTLPDPTLVKRRRALIDYRKVVLDPDGRTVTVDPGMRVGLGGIAKGYAVDRAAAALERHGVKAFLVQAGGDLLGRGRKPDGSPWVSGIQDPRGPHGTFFATIELENRAFSTAGDYARAFVLRGKRYHHIIDPRTGYPATASRSVTVWAPSALVADAIDDAVFILGAERGLEIVESLHDVGAVVVTADNRVVVSARLKGKVTVSRAPTDGL